MSSTTTILVARFVAPVLQPLIRDGAVAVAKGVIVDVGKTDDVALRHPSARVTELRDQLLLPGLVNAHTHLELSNCTPGESPGGSFVDWILSVRSRMKIDESNPAVSIIPATEGGIEQSLRFGVTCVGDISRFCSITRPVLRRSPLRAVSFGEVLGLGKLRSRVPDQLKQAVDRREDSPRLRAGLTPHAPYTVDLPAYRECIDIAQRSNYLLATHLAETLEENEFLLTQRGPFRNLWEKLNCWEDPVETYPGSAVAFAHAVGLLDTPAVLAHVNYCSDDELTLLAAGRASVVYCPRTHRYFGHPPHRWQEMIGMGINVAVGTDSCASSPDLNLVDDLRLMHALAPDDPDLLWRIGTVHGARALGLQDQIGSISAGKSADLIAFKVTSDEPLREVLESNILPTHVWIEGCEVTQAAP